MARIAKAWPPEISGYIEFVYHELDYLKDVLTVCKREGIERPDYVLVTKLLSVIREAVQRIDMAILESDEVKPDARPGQVPTWRNSHEFILYSAVNLAECNDKLAEQARHKQWSTASKLIDACIREIDEMRAEIEQAPFPATDDRRGIVVSNWPVNVERKEE